LQTSRCTLGEGDGERERERVRLEREREGGRDRKKHIVNILSSNLHGAFDMF
jgi:hypothetical protein